MHLLPNCQRGKPSNSWMNVLYVEIGIVFRLCLIKYQPANRQKLIVCN